MNSKNRPPMTTAQVAAYADATGLVLNIAMPGEYRDAVVANLDQLLQFGWQVMSFPLPEDTELAPVFRP